MMKIDTSQLKVVYLPGAHPDAAFREAYRRTFETWWGVWKEFFSGLPEPIKLWSDHFTRQEEIASLFYGERCIGMSFFRWVDFELVDQARDSYFKLWGDEELKGLLKHGTRVCVPSFLTVHEDFRRSRCDLDVRRLVLGLVTKRFLASEADVMPVVTRNARGVNDVFYSHGALALKTDVVNFHPQDLVDLVVIYRENGKMPEDQPFRGILENVWETRQFVGADMSHLHIAPPAERRAA